MDPCSSFHIGSSKTFTDTQQGRDRNRTPIINLLPMACKQFKQQHIFLRVDAPLTEGWRTFVPGAEKNFA